MSRWHVIIAFLSRSQWRTDENDNIPSYKEHIYPSNGTLDNGFFRLGVDFGSGDRLLDFAQDHVEVLIVGLCAIAKKLMSARLGRVASAVIYYSTQTSIRAPNTRHAASDPFQHSPWSDGDNVHATFPLIPDRRGI